MRVLTIDIELENEAFQPYANPEISRILRKIADAYSSETSRPSIIRDINGNTVGAIKVIKHKEAQ